MVASLSFSFQRFIQVQQQNDPNKEMPETVSKPNSLRALAQVGLLLTCWLLTVYPTYKWQQSELNTHDCIPAWQSASFGSLYGVRVYILP